MRAFVAIAALTLLGGTVAACAAVGGLDAFSKGECSGGDCDAGEDGGAPDQSVPHPSDASADGTADRAIIEASGDDAQDDGDAPFTQPDAGGPDAGSDAGSDAGFDAPSDAGGPEGGPDGCGPLNTTTNCTACGLACDMTHSTGATCNGTTCSYTGCAAGWGDCNITAPDTNGCETSLSSITNCGACGVSCGSMDVTLASCNGTTCSYTCAAGWANCVTTPPNATGCETPTNTVDNCGGCNVACIETNATAATCSGVSCSYTCTADHADCNSAIPPDTDGCECDTPGCCSGACQTTHSDGVGDSYYDCNPLKTYSATTALEACAAFAGSDSKCSSYTCGPVTVICSDGAANCDCWQYSGSRIGQVDVNSNTTCYCPIAGDPTWD